MRPRSGVPRITARAVVVFKDAREIVLLSINATGTLNSAASRRTGSGLGQLRNAQPASLKKYLRTSSLSAICVWTPCKGHLARESLSPSIEALDGDRSRCFLVL